PVPSLELRRRQLDSQLLAGLSDGAGDTLLTGQDVAHRRRPNARSRGKVRSSLLNQVLARLIPYPDVHDPIVFALRQFAPTNHRSARARPGFVEHVADFHAGPSLRRVSPQLSGLAISQWCPNGSTIRPIRHP